MMEKDRKQQIRREVLFLAMLILSCLGAGGFAISCGLSAYHINEQYNEQSARLGAESISVLKNNDSSIGKITVISLKGTPVNSDKIVELVLNNRTIFDRELMLIGIGSTATLLLFFLILRSIHKSKGITFSDRLICYFPEEIVSELAALREQLTKEKKLNWLIRSILFYQILTLVWGIYIQINIDNLTLPSRDRRIDK
jgi:hypothetical protein